MTPSPRIVCWIVAALLSAAANAQPARGAGCHLPDRAEIGLDFSAAARWGIESGFHNHAPASGSPSRLDDPASGWRRIPCEPVDSLPSSAAPTPPPLSGSHLLGKADSAGDRPGDWLYIQSATRLARHRADILERPPRLHNSMR